MSAFLRSRGFATGYAAMLVGLAVLLTGLAVDLSLHAGDPDLAKDEGLLGLTNPGHLLFIAGLSVVLMGAFVGPYSRWVVGRGALPSLAVPAAVLAIALSASLAFVSQLDSLAGDDHGDSAPEAAAHAPEEPSAAAGHAGEIPVLSQHRLLVALEESTFHEPPNTAPVTEENVRFAQDFIAKAKVETAKYQDVAVAQADGYVQITQDLPLIGAHFFNAAYVGGLDPAHPAILLYSQTPDGGWELAGLSFALPKQLGLDTLPGTPFGGLAHWHYHTNLCFGAGSATIAGTAAECAGLFVQETPWLLHVWVWRESPEGVFHHANSLLQ